MPTKGRLRVDDAPDTWLDPRAPLVALDLDGTVADYYGHFKWFAELYLQTPLPLDWSNTDEFSDALHLDKETYRDIKLAYRQGGMKRSIPILDPGCWRLAERIRALGVQVWVTTTRPWQRLDNIDPDTQFWINRNLGKVDGVIYGEDKYRDLVAINGAERVLYVFDDLPENVRRAKDLGLRAGLRIGPHNEQVAGALGYVSNGQAIFNATRQMWQRYINDKEHMDAE